MPICCLSGHILTIESYMQLREAVECMPALVVLDDLHLLCPAPSQAPEAVLANIGSAALVAWLREVLREYHARPNGRPALPGEPSNMQ